MSNQVFKPGDLVELKSGSPVMTVQGQNDFGETNCVWYCNVSNEFKRFAFWETSLKLSSN